MGRKTIGGGLATVIYNSITKERLKLKSKLDRGTISAFISYISNHWLIIHAWSDIVYII